MDKKQILESKGLDSGLFEFYYVTDEGMVVSPESDYDGNILKTGEEVYQEWVKNKDKQIDICSEVKSNQELTEEMETLQKTIADLEIELITLS